MAFGQLILIRTGFRNLEVSEYGQLLRYVSLYAIITVIFGGPAMTLAILNFKDGKIVSDVSKLLTNIASCAFLCCLALSSYGIVKGNSYIVNNATFTGIAIFSVYVNSAQRGSLASKGKWLGVFVALSLEGTLKTLFLLINQLFATTNELGYFVSLIIIPQLIATGILSMRANPFEVLSQHEKRRTSVLLSLKELSSIWIAGAGSVLATALPIFVITNKNFDVNQGKILATSLILFRVPISFLSAALTPFTVEEARSFQERGQTMSLVGFRQFFKDNGFKLSSFSAVYTVMAMTLLIVFFGLPIIPVVEIGIVIMFSTQLYFWGESMSSVMQAQERFLLAVPGWLVSTLVLWISLFFSQDNSIWISTTLVISGGTLVAVQHLIFFYAISKSAQ